MLGEGRAVTAGSSPEIVLSARTKAAGRSPGNRRLLEVGLGANMALRLAFLFFIAGLMPSSLLRPLMDSRRCPAICCGVVDCLSPPPASRSGDGPTTLSSQGAYWRRLTGSARVPHNSRYFQCRLCPVTHCCRLSQVPHNPRSLYQQLHSQVLLVPIQQPYRRLAVPLEQLPATRSSPQHLGPPPWFLPPAVAHPCGIMHYI